MCKSKSFYFLITFSFLITYLFISNLVFAQITIEEKVEIEPRSAVFALNNPASSHTIRIEIQWTPFATEGAVIAYSLPCQDASFSGFVTGGNLTFLVENVVSGGHSFQFRFNIPCSNPQPVDGQYQLYFDDQLVQSNSFSVGGCYSGLAYPFYNFSYTPPLVSDYYLRLSSLNLCYREEVDIWVDPSSSCETGTAWNKETEILTFNIINGQEYASFYDSNDQLLGETVTGTWNNIDAVIKLDSSYTGIGIGYVLLSAQWGGVEKIDSLKIYPVNNNTINYDIEIGDTLGPGDETDIYLSIGTESECIYNVEENMTYQMEIIYGQQFGNMINLITGEKVKQISGYFSYFGSTRFIYKADGTTPNSLDSVIIRIGASELEIPFTDLILYIKPPPIYVYTVPNVVRENDTADVVIKHRLEDGTLEDFPAEQTFELAVLDGCVNGNFLVEDSINVYFTDAVQPVKFVTADSLESDSGYVRLRVGTDIIGSMMSVSKNTGEEEKQRELNVKTGYTHAELRAGFEKMMEEKKAEQLAEKLKIGGESVPEAPIVEACHIGGSSHQIYWEGNISVQEDKTIEILLGETKYFQAKYNTENKLIIEEVDTPELNGGLREDVWENNPVSIVEGDKLGVYWEKEKPVWNANVKGANLAKGLIRLVGRYYNLKNEEPYKVKLTAQDGIETTSIEILVKKPVKLGNSNATSIDVFGESVYIDEICIEWGNELGIPPHFIKGHMKGETSQFHPFYPTYVYEPYTTQFKVLKTHSDNQYFIEDDETTFDPPLPNHSNVEDYSYPSSPTTVWQMIEDYSDLVNLVSLRKYGSRRATDHSSVEDGVLDFYGVYSYPKNKYDSYKDEAYERYDVKKNPEKEPEANNDARDSLVNHLKNEWDGKIKDGKKGLINIPAQTRIAASYGLLQMLYVTALDEFKYSKNSAPESLIEPDNMSYAKQKIEEHLKQLISKENGSTNNWSLGLEGVVRKYIWHKWNPGWIKYPDHIYENVLLYKEIQ